MCAVLIVVHGALQSCRSLVDALQLQHDLNKLAVIVPAFRPQVDCLHDIRQGLRGAVRWIGATYEGAGNGGKDPENGWWRR